MKKEDWFILLAVSAMVASTASFVPSIAVVITNEDARAEKTRTVHPASNGKDRKGDRRSKKSDHQARGLQR